TTAPGAPQEEGEGARSMQGPLPASANVSVIEADDVRLWIPARRCATVASHDRRRRCDPSPTDRRPADASPAARPRSGVRAVVSTLPAPLRLGLRQEEREGR